VRRPRDRWLFWTTGALFLGSLFAFSLADIGVFLGLIALIVVGYWGVAWFRQAYWPEIAAHYREHGLLIAVSDGVFVLALYLLTSGFSTWWALIPALAASFGLRRLKARRRLPRPPPLH
jgi:hypothetical protein